MPKNVTKPMWTTPELSRPAGSRRKQSAIAALGVAAVLLVAGCSTQSGISTASPSPSMAEASSAAPGTTQAATPTTTAQPSTQPLGKGTVDDATLDKAFLAGVRKTVPASLDDATLISMGRGMCADLAAGVPAQAAIDKVKAHGLSQNDGLIFLVAAKAVYCSTVK